MTTIILTLGCVFIIFFLLVEWRNKSSKIKLQQQRSLLVLRKLYNLITSLQKHRGISASLLRGERNALPPLDNIRSQVNAHTSFLNNQLKIKYLDRWIGFNDHWFRLQRNSHHLSVENSFEQHSNIIANLLLLFEDFAKIEKFNHKRFRKLPNLTVLWRDLPILIEYMGQVRAIGIGVIIDGGCSHMKMLKLNVLIKEITHLSKIVLLHLGENGDKTSRHRNLLLQAREASAQLTHTALHQLISAKQIRIDVESFFVTASHAMETNAYLLDYELEQIARILALPQISELNKDTALNKKVN